MVPYLLKYLCKYACPSAGEDAVQTAICDTRGHSCRAMEQVPQNEANPLGRGAVGAQPVAILCNRGLHQPCHATPTCSSSTHAGQPPTPQAKATRACRFGAKRIQQSLNQNQKGRPLRMLRGIWGRQRKPPADYCPKNSPMEPAAAETPSAKPYPKHKAFFDLKAETNSSCKRTRTDALSLFKYLLRHLLFVMRGGRRARYSRPTTVAARVVQTTSL